MDPVLPAGPLLLFDGYCHLCSRSVQFILKHEKDHDLLFAPIESTIGQHILRNFAVDLSTADSLIYYKQDTVLIYSDAALACVDHLHDTWRWLRILRLLPKPIRDRLYRFIASRRYRWFGQRMHCFVPDETWHHRFLN